MTDPILLPYQRRLFEASAPLIVVEKSRRIGATWAFAAKLVDQAARSRAAGGCDGIYMSTSQRLGRIFIRDCAKWALAMGAAILGYHRGAEERPTLEECAAAMGVEILKDEIRFASGHTITAVPSNPESVRGMGGDTIIDEAAFHLDLEEILKAAEALGDWGGRLTVISTHNGDANPFARLVEELREGQRPGELHRITIQEALADGLHRRRCELRGVPYTRESEAEWLARKAKSWGFSEEYEVIPSSGTGVYFPRVIVEGAGDPGIEVIRWDLRPDFINLTKTEQRAIADGWIAANLVPRLEALPRDELHYLGGDVGRSGTGDLSVFVLLGVHPRTAARVARIVVELRGVPFEEQWAILGLLGTRAPRLVGGGVDRVGIGAWLAEKAERTFGKERIEAVALSDTWYLGAMPKLRTALDEGALVQPADRDLEGDLQLVRVISGIPKLPRDARTRCSRTGLQRHGDYAVALALANERVPHPGAGDFRAVTREDDLERFLDNPRTGRSEPRRLRSRRGAL